MLKTMRSYDGCGRLRMMSSAWRRRILARLSKLQHRRHRRMRNGPRLIWRDMPLSHLPQPSARSLQEQRVTRILMSSPKGGVGRSCLAAHLALALSRLGRRVLVIDLDPRNGLADLLLPGAELSPGIGAALQGDALVEPTLVATSVYFAPYGLTVAPPAASAALEPETVDQLISTLTRRSGADIVVIDAESAREAAVPLKPHDAEVCVFLPDAGSMAALRMSGLVTALLSRSGSQTRFGVLNAVDLRRPLARAVLSTLSSDRFPAWLPFVRYDEAIAEAHAQNRTVFDTAPESVSILDIQALASALLERLGLAVAPLAARDDLSHDSGYASPA